MYASEVQGSGFEASSASVSCDESLGLLVLPRCGVDLKFRVHGTLNPKLQALKPFTCRALCTSGKLPEACAP